MAYRIKPGRPVAKNVRRIGRSELDRALAALADPDELGVDATIHEVRKRCKKTRGLLRLARAGLGGEYGRANALVRDAARELGPLRDAHALLATFEELVEGAHGDRLPGDGLEGVRAGLAERAHEAARRSPDEPLAHAAELLERARSRVGRWSPDDDAAILVAGVAENHRRARRAFRRALEHPSDAALHEWRKRAKYGWHHAKLLRPVAPSALGPLARRLKDLSDCLGDDHDLALLRASLLAEPAAFGGGHGEAIALIDAVRADMRDRCLRLGARLHAEPPKALGRRVGRYWVAWHAVGPERPLGDLEDLYGQPADRPPDAADLLGAASA